MKMDTCNSCGRPRKFVCWVFLIYFPMYIAMGLTKILVQMKLPKEQEASKEKKKEKRREKERKEKREKSKDDRNSSKHREHGHKKRKHEEKNELPRKDGLHKAAASKEVIEQLEKSGLTEEHGLPCAIQEPCESSESTQNCSKSRKLEVPSISGGSHGSTILRLRLPLQKHRDPKPTSSSVNDERLLGRVTSKDLKATPASEGTCFPSYAFQAVTTASEGPCFSGRTTTEVLTASPSSEGPCFSARATSKDLKVIAASKGPCLSVRATPKVLRATLASEGLGFSGRSISKDLEEVPASEAPSCFSCRATEVPLLHKLSNNAHSQPIERGKLQLSNAHSLSVENIKSTEAPQEHKFDENVHIHSSSSSKGSKRARKLEKRFRDLIVSWKPASLLLDAEPGTEDLSWLIGNSGQHRVKSDAMSCGVSSTVEEVSSGSSVFSFQPRALYLPDLEMYQLPYVVPF